jgi:hypothetical protein
MIMLIAELIAKQEEIHRDEKPRAWNSIAHCKHDDRTARLLVLHWLHEALTSKRISVNQIDLLRESTFPA